MNFYYIFKINKDVLFGIKQGVSLAVSGFCNSGYALITDNLIPYNSDPIIILTVSFLIIFGGIAPVIAITLPKFLRGEKISPVAKIVFNTTIAGIYGFQKLEPSINLLNSSNTQSLYYAEQMLTSISVKKNLAQFEKILHLAGENVTEEGEKDIIDQIASEYLPAFKGNKVFEEQTINDIAELAKINRIAMEQAGVKAKKQQAVGIWIILFPSIFIWIIGITLLKRLNRIFIKPVQELNDVIFEYNKGNLMRRCPSVTYSKDIQKLYDGINIILDNK